MHKLTLHNDTIRQRALSIVQQAPEGYVVTVAKPKRSLDQNARLWPLLRPIARRVVWFGELRPEQHWKDFFLDMMGIECASMPDENGAIIYVGHSSSKLDKPTFSILMDLIEAFKDRHGISEDSDDFLYYPINPNQTMRGAA